MSEGLALLFFKLEDNHERLRKDSQLVPVGLTSLGKVLPAGIQLLSGTALM